MEKAAEEQIDDLDDNWLELEDATYDQLNMGNITNIAFAVADSPFQKSEVAKYYPEVVVVNNKGEIVTRISDSNDKCEEFPGLHYMDSFRDEKLTINDDRKVRMNLDDFMESGD
jgi:hypothetical protein